jgi:uracil-DNA glycosylase
MPPGLSPQGYWDHANFKLVDKINAEMWTRSPQLQREIQPPADLAQPGSVGPQQAMQEPDAALAIDADTVLPWVPDIVGKEADGDRAVLVFGAAYAGFIHEYSSRDACLPLADYVEAAKRGDSGGWAAFQRLFLDSVVTPDDTYYGKLASLLTSAGVSANRIVLSDLCPSSFVKRTSINNRRQDDSSQPGKGRAGVFCKYVEHQTVAGWTWRRITESRAERIIALGHIAEHGLLRLFSRHGATISCNGRQWNQDRQSEDLPTGEWVDRYADEQKTLGHWLTPGRWWTISMQGRNLRLLPVYHPSRVEQYDPDYSQTGDALAAWLRW